MTAERRREMQVYRKQAQITEVRLKTRSREKEFLNRVERSLEEIQRETSEKEVPLTRRGILSESSQFTPSLEPYEHINNNAAAAEEGSDSSTIPGEIIHLKPSVANTMKIKYESRRDSDSVQTSDSDDLIVVTVPKIHRRRRESGGSTGSDASRPDVSRQRTGSTSSISSEPVRVRRNGSLSTADHAAVRRTGSDSSCRLRRSGSERALKRSGSDKTLRRTGSGDIPTAIVSESTPRMHRRVGSGDMSSLHSNKQSAINKLTRSYDMSIRSLMSEELSVKVLQSDFRDQSSNELLTVEPASHNMMLSPKFASHSKEVKLMTRPSNQPLKKQAHKDSGPPQPVKAIHTLPPSLPTSRENTFDSLPQRSPSGSDNDDRASLKSLPITADSLDISQKKESSLQKVELSPQRAEPNPQRAEPSPQRAELSPQRAELSPQRAELSPHPPESSQQINSPKKVQTVHQKTVGVVSPQMGGVSSQVDRVSPAAGRESSHIGGVSPPLSPISSSEGGASLQTKSPTREQARHEVQTASRVIAPSNEEEEETIHLDAADVAPPGEKEATSSAITSERLLDAVAFTESHDYERAGSVDKPPAAIDVWNVTSDPRASVGSPGFLHLPSKLRPSNENSLTQQWLVDKISQLHSSGEVNLEDWLQNAPDSVKQRLSQLLPPEAASNPASNPVSNAPIPRDSELFVSVDDDTLRSTSPLPESEQVLESEAMTADTQETAMAGDSQERRGPLFVRSNSYTLDKPSVALLIADRASRTKTPNNSPPSFFPSPDKSDSLPITHNRLEGKRSVPSDVSSTSSRSQASRQPTAAKVQTKAQPTSPPETQPKPSPKPSPKKQSKPQPVSIKTHHTDHLGGPDVPPHSPNAIERNKAIASKSYVVSKPSAALLDSLNDSQKSAIDSLRESGATTTAPTDDDISTVSDDTLRLSTAEFKGSPSKRGSAQRKLEYFSLENLAAADSKSDSLSAYYTGKYESPEKSKSAHIQRYLQQLGLAREEWADAPHKPTSSQSRAGRAQSSTSSSPESDDSGRAGVRTSGAKNYTSRQRSRHADPSSSPSTKKAVYNTEMFNRVRRELTLLKSKHSNKLSPRESTNQRPSTAQPPNHRPATAQPANHRPNTAQPAPQNKGKANRPGTAFAHISPYAQRHQQLQQSLQQSLSSSAEVNLAQLRERLQSTNKHSAGLSSAHVKSFAEKEATPISTGYSSSHLIPSIDESVSEYSSYGAIHSVTHPRPPTAAASPSPADYSYSSQLTARPSSRSEDLLAAVIKGHLCRRLLHTSKVQSIVKTIRDCQSLMLQQSASARATISSGQPSQAATLMALQNLNFQERLLDQWQAALLDIHEIFFELPVDKRVSLIHQSEVMEAKVRAQQLLKQAKIKVVHRPSNKEQQSPKKRISSTTQKVIERKKVQKSAVTEPVKKPVSAVVTLKKAVLAPTFAANSPKRPATSARVTKTYLRQSPVKHSADSAVVRQASRV